MIISTNIYLSTSIGDNVPSGLWSCMEMDVGVICACLPSLKPFFAQFFGSSNGNKSRSRTATSSFQVLSEDQQALHQSHVEVELYDRENSKNIVRTDDFMVKSSYMEEGRR